MRPLDADYQALRQKEISLRDFLKRHPKIKAVGTQRLPEISGSGLESGYGYDCFTHAELRAVQLSGIDSYYDVDWELIGISGAGSNPRKGTEIPWSEAKKGDWVRWPDMGGHYGVVIDPNRKIVESCWGYGGVVFQHPADYSIYNGRGRVFPVRPKEERVARRLQAGNRYYRIQPAGKPLRRSKDWNGKPLDGMFVFKSLKYLKEATLLWRPSEFKGAEVVEIHYSGKEWEHPVEAGTLIDPDKARITKRFSIRDYLGPKEASPSRIAARKQAEMSHAASIALMKWLSKVAKSMGVAKHVYVVGGAVRNFLIDKPIKDIDMVVDSLALKGNRDSAWVSQQIARRIPTQTDIVTDNLMVSKVFIKGPWELDGHQMEGEVIEIVNAREEVYEEDIEGNFLGHKPIRVDPTSLDVDVTRREFTFNTLMWSLADLASGPDKAEIIDLTGCGLKDLENREMRCPQDPDKTFAQDPTRIIRTIKFAFKYGFKLPPDVKAAAKRQAKGLKRIPSKAWGALRDIVLENPQYKKALLVMDDLGVIEVLKDMVQADKSFANTLSNYTRNRGIAFMFDLMDLGLPVGTVGFLSGPEIKRFREITTPMDREEAQAFRDALQNPGMAYQDKKFIPSLAREMGVPGNKMKDFMPSVTAIARELLLENPKLMGRSLTNLVRQEAKGLKMASRVAVRSANPRA